MYLIIAWHGMTFVSNESSRSGDESSSERWPVLRVGLSIRWLRTASSEEQASYFGTAVDAIHFLRFKYVSSLCAVRTGASYFYRNLPSSKIENVLTKGSALLGHKVCSSRKLMRFFFDFGRKRTLYEQLMYKTCWFIVITAIGYGWKWNICDKTIVD
jgi:hypothetical protein